MKNSMQERFIENYCRTGNATQSAIDSGYSEKTARQKGYALKKQFSNEISEIINKDISSHLPIALNAVIHLIENAESEAVKLSAAKDIMDRGGLKPVERIEQTNVDQMSLEEINRELDALDKLQIN
tara:strand:+ start:1226 stop:1603 length:378 start_codon:yes stop_codon:yes gene_type:complete